MGGDGAATGRGGASSAAVAAGNLETTRIGRPLGTASGMSWQSCSGSGVGVEEPAASRTPTRSSTSRGDSSSLPSATMRGSSRCNTGSMGPRRSVRSAGRPAARGSYVRARLLGVQVVGDRVAQAGEGAVVEERRLQRDVAERRRPERVAIDRIGRELLAPEVFVVAGAAELEVPLLVGEVAGIAPRPQPEPGGRHLRNAGDVRLEVAEQLVRFAGHRVALNAGCLGEEGPRAALLLRRQRVALAARKAIDRARWRTRA